MIDIQGVLTIITTALSVLVGFLLLFLQFYPQRKRTLLQTLQINKLCTENKKIKQNIDQSILELKKIDETKINTFNFSVFVYSIVIFCFSLVIIWCYFIKEQIPDISIPLLIILTIIGYLLLIPLVIISYLERRRISVELKKNNDVR